MNIPTKLLAAVAAASLVLVAPSAGPAEAAVPDYTTAESGNPIVDGWYADPDVAVYGDTYWIYPTSSRPYDEQTYLDAFSSTDLVNWTKHSRVLSTDTVSWAKRAIWAPSPIQRNGKYYLYFGANDAGNDTVGGIGVGVADRPEGPYVDAIGRPLINKVVNGAQAIDQDVFIDDDGQAYMYYGGWAHANVVKLNPDMKSLDTFSDGSTFKEITPQGYTEGAEMFKRNGIYYLMWSEGYWGGSEYSVSYAMSSSPTGPFVKRDTILTQDSAIAKGSGHNSVINVPGTDTWYILYHRRPLSETDGNHRQLAYDRMTFNADGTIKPVTMQVKDNFADGNSLGWKMYDGSWSVNGGRLQTSSSYGGKAMLDTNFGDFTYDADVTVSSGGGDAGLTFRVSQPGNGTDTYRGYYAGISTGGRVVLGRAANSWTQLGSANMTITPGSTHRMRVTAVGSSIKVFVDDMSTPRISTTDTAFASGANGVRVFDTAAAFDNVAVGQPTGVGVNLAQGRQATGSTACSPNEVPAKAVNGSTGGGNADKFCSSAPNPWLQVDLGSVQHLGRLEVAHAQAGGEAAASNTRAYTISVSDDGQSWRQAVSVTNNTAATTTHEVSTSGRYVRLDVSAPTVDGDGAARIYELRAFN